eukprot:gene11789-5126_t
MKKIPTWKKLKNESGPRFRHTCFSYNEFVYVLGGEETSKGQIFKYNSKTEEWTGIKSSDKLENGIQNCTCNVYKNHMYVVCGVDNSLVNPNNTVECLNLLTEEWQNYELENSPKSRYLHTTCLYNDSLFVFGGYFLETNNDLYELDLLKMKFKKIEYSGEILKRFNHNSVIYKDSMYIYGGYSLMKDTPDRTTGSNHNNDFMEYDFKSQHFRKLITSINIRPIPRWGSTCGMYKDFMILFGGADDEYTDLNDLFIYDFLKFQWKKINSDNTPWMRWGHSSTNIDNLFFVLGGELEDCAEEFFEIDMNTMILNIEDLLFDKLNKELFSEEILEFEEKYPSSEKYQKILNTLYKKEYLKYWKIDITREYDWKQLYFEKVFLEKFSKYFEFNKFEDLKKLIQQFGKYVYKLSISQQMVSKNFEFKSLILSLENIKEIRFHNFKSISKPLEILKYKTNIKSVKFFHCFFSALDLDVLSIFLVGKKTTKYQTEQQRFQFKPFSISLLDDIEEEIEEDDEDDFDDIYGDIYQDTTPIKINENPLELKELEFSSVPLDNGLEYISEIIGNLKSLEIIKFSYNQIKQNETSIMFIKSIKDNQNLKEISITENFMDDILLDEFSSGTIMKSLKKLSFSNNMITNIGINSMLNLLKMEDCDIENLDLSANFIGNENSLKLISQNFEKLKILNLSSCGIDLGLNFPIFDLFFEELSKNTTLEVLSLSGNSMINPISLSTFFSNNNTLKSLDISDCTVNFTSQLEKSIVENNSLEFLNLSECRLGDENGKFICKVLEKIKQKFSINISDNSFTDEFAKLLLKINLENKLKMLDLTQNDFSLDTRELLKKKFSKSIEFLFIGFKIGNTRRSEPCDGSQMSSIFES